MLLTDVTKEELIKRLRAIRKITYAVYGLITTHKGKPDPDCGACEGTGRYGRFACHCTEVVTDVAAKIDQITDLRVPFKKKTK